MTAGKIATITGAAVVLAIIAALAWLTEGNLDPCSAPQSDIGAAVLADPDGDQDALVNRAMIIRALCEPKNAEQEPADGPAEETQDPEQ